MRSAPDSARNGLHTRTVVGACLIPTSPTRRFPSLGPTKRKP